MGTKAAIIAMKAKAGTYNVFISYATPDLRGIGELLAKSVTPGVRPYVADRMLPPGAQMTPTIAAEIQTSDLFILMWSPRSAASEWVNRELGMAIQSKRPILPVLLPDAPPLPAFLRDTKYISTSASIEAASAQLRELLQRHLGTKRAGQNGWLVAGGLLALLIALAGRSE